MSSRGQVFHAALALATVLTTAGCDIVQGFQNAGDALFPPQKTYLETPGFRLAEGSFYRLNVGIGDELYLLARSADETVPALYAMRYLDPKPCRIEGVGRYWSTGLPSEHPSQILFLEGDLRRGTLHFADAHCNVHDFVIEDAELPMQETELGLLLFAGTSLVLVKPVSKDVRTIASGVQALYMNGPGAHFLLVGGKLEAYDVATWSYIGSVGENVVGAPRTVGGSFVFQDDTGVNRVSASGVIGMQRLTVESIDEEGCRLGWVSGGSVLSYYSPCADSTLALWEASTNKTTRPDYVADPVYFAVERDPEADTTSPKLDQDYFYYSLRDLTGDGGGTLVVRTPSGDEHVLGTGARLDQTNFDNDGEYGLALLDVAGEAGRLVRWDREGTTETLATGVFYGSSDLLVNWNGVVGDRARLTDEGELEILLERVPRRDHEYQDITRRWQATFDDSDGITGTLSIDSSGSRTFANRRVIARNVRHPRHQFLDVVLPGIAYIANYDPMHDTGRLEYNNLELGFRGVVSDGVADFIPAGNGILYTIPFGDARGVWLARAQ